jgi:hypothetical protein
VTRAAKHKIGGLDQAAGELTQSIDAILADTDD